MINNEPGNLLKAKGRHADIFTLTIVVPVVLPDWGSLAIVSVRSAGVDKFWELSFLVVRLVMR
jgi:hypothetical protein